MERKSKHNLPFWHFTLSLKEVFKNPPYIVFFTALSFIFYLLLIFVPAKIIPGNSFKFQLALMTLSDHLLLASLSLITSLNLTFHLYLFKKKKQDFSVAKGTSDSALGFFSGLIATVFGTATCGLCVATIFGYFGFATVLFLLKWRLYIVALAVLLSLISLYFLSRKISTPCAVCQN